MFSALIVSFGSWVTEQSVLQHDEPMAAAFRKDHPRLSAASQLPMLVVDPNSRAMLWLIASCRQSTEPNVSHRRAWLSSSVLVHALAHERHNDPFRFGVSTSSLQRAQYGRFDMAADRASGRTPDPSVSAPTLALTINSERSQFA
ncbi:hypothetical protein ACVMIH_007728 [Bradyrhizobium sp. USDA 4503]